MAPILPPLCYNGEAYFAQWVVWVLPKRGESLVRTSTHIDDPPARVVMATIEVETLPLRAVPWLRIMRHMRVPVQPMR